MEPDDVVRQLLTISRDLEPRLLDALRERGHEALRPSFARFLYLVWDEPRPLGEIAMALGLSRQAVSQLARRVEAAGYAERRPNPADARSRLVAITPRGRAVDDERAHEAIAKCEAHYEAIVGMTALGDFVEALGVLRDALDVPSHRASARTSLGVLPLVALATRDALVQLIMDAGYDDVRPSHVDLLPLVTGTGARPVDVARHQGISRQAASATLQELEQLGYLDRRPDPDDQRGVVFTVTNLGLSLLEVDASGRLALGSWFKKLLTPSRYNAFRSVARNLVQALEPSRTELENLAHSLRHQLGSQGAARLAALLVQDAT